MKLLSGYFFRYIFRADLALLLISIAVFAIYPSIDTLVSSLVYDGAHFIYRDLSWVKLSYKVFANLHFFILPLLATFIVGLSFIKDRTLWQTQLKKRCSYLLLAILIGPGLLVNIALKDNSTGRPRPAQTVEFGGAHNFSSPFQLADVCAKNCSFVSGHASLAFFLMSFGWALRSRNFFLIAFFIGVIAGTGRIFQGAHYISDVIFAFWVTYLVSLSLAKVYGFSLSVSDTADDIRHRRSLDTTERIQSGLALNRS